MESIPGLHKRKKIRAPYRMYEVITLLVFSMNDLNNTYCMCFFTTCTYMFSKISENYFVSSELSQLLDSNRYRIKAGSLKMNTALEYMCAVQEWSRRGAVDVKRVFLTI